MIELIVERLDRLVKKGAITGYTVEPPPLYLESRWPTMTYGMYAGDALSRRNIHAVVDDLSTLGARLRLRPVQGNVRRDNGRIERTDQVRIAAGFKTGAQLGQALQRIRSRYVAGNGTFSQPASWLFPDVRLTGLEGSPVGTIRAVAHTTPVGRRSVVVLSLSPRPPVDGMRSYPVYLLERWATYLDGKHVAGAWTAAPDEDQRVTAPLVATVR